MNSGRILIFNGKILADSSSVTAQYKGIENSRCKKFSSVDVLCDEMEKISQATTSMGKGKIRDLGEILYSQDLFLAVRSVQKNELLLVKTRYESIGNIEQYENFTKQLGKLPGLVMVGVWTEHRSRFTPDGAPILIW